MCKRKSKNTCICLQTSPSDSACCLYDRSPAVTRCLRPSDSACCLYDRSPAVTRCLRPSDSACCLYDRSPAVTRCLLSNKIKQLTHKLETKPIVIAEISTYTMKLQLDNDDDDMHGCSPTNLQCCPSTRMPIHRDCTEPYRHDAKNNAYRHCLL